MFVGTQLHISVLSAYPLMCMLLGECIVCSKAGTIGEEVNMCPGKKCGVLFHRECVSSHMPNYIINSKITDSLLCYVCYTFKNYGGGRTKKGIHAILEKQSVV